MPRTCAVRGCPTNRHFYEPGVRFFRIPQDDADMQARWVALLGRASDWKVPTIQVVCERHFAPGEVVGGERGLAPTVVPSIGLPAAAEGDEEEEQEVEIKEEPEMKAVKNKKRGVQSRERLKRRKVEDREPELVLVPEIPEVAYDALCRFCALELKPTAGWDIDKLKVTETVRDSIWKLCLVEDLEDLMEYLYPRRICDGCWQSMQSFENFVGGCLQKQQDLKTRIESVIKDEPVDYGESESEVEQLEVAPTKSSSKKLKVIKDESLNYGESESESEVEHQPPVPTKSSSKKLLPKDKDAKPPDLVLLDKLKGLTIDEMIEFLDNLPPGGKLFSALAPDTECYDCGQLFPNRNRMRTHRNTCTAIGTPESLRNRSYTCEICAKPYNSRLGYRMHLYKIHYSQPDFPEDQWPEELKRMQGKKQLLCPVCSDRFHQLHQLKYHLKTHKRRSEPHKGRQQSQGGGGIPRDKTCKLCGKTFANPFYMETHMKFHNREKNFECDQCHKRFYIKHDLKDHVASVHGQHKFLCVSCGKTFGTRRGLVRHALVHDESGSREMFSCEYCQKKFNHAYQLKYHVMKHTGERRHHCELCGVAYRFRYMLTYHKRDKHGLVVDGDKLARQNSVDDKNDDDGHDDGDGDDEGAMEVEALDDSGDVSEPVGD